MMLDKLKSKFNVWSLYYRTEIVYFIGGFIIGAIFIWASYDKIIDPGKFAREISNYRIVPFGLER